MNNVAPKLQKMLNSQNRPQNYSKNAKTTKFLSVLAFYTFEGHTCKVLSFYNFWFMFNDKACSPLPDCRLLGMFNHQNRKP